MISLHTGTHPQPPFSTPLTQDQARKQFVEDYKNSLKTACEEPSPEHLTQLLDSNISTPFIQEIEESEFALQLLLSVGQKAIQTENFTFLEVLLSQVTTKNTPLFDPNETSDEHPRSLFSIACQAGSIEAIELLLRHQVDPTLDSHKFIGMHPLEILCRNNDLQSAICMFTKTNPDLWKTLLSSTNESNQTVLDIAKEMNSLALIDLFTNPQEIVWLDEFAARFEDQDRVKMQELLDNPLAFSVIQQRLPSLDLFEYFTVCDEDFLLFLLSWKNQSGSFLFDGPTLFRIYIYESEKTLLQALLKKRYLQSILVILQRNEIFFNKISTLDIEGDGVIHLAALANCKEIISLLASALPHESLELKNRKQNATALHLAAFAAKPQDCSALEALLHLKVDPNSKMNGNLTALDLLCDKLSKDTLFLNALKLLLSKGALIKKMKIPSNLRNLVTSTSSVLSSEAKKQLILAAKEHDVEEAFFLNCAAKDYTGARECLQLLHEQDPQADPWIDSRGYQPLHYLWEDALSLRSALDLFPHWINSRSGSYFCPPFVHALKQQRALSPFALQIFIDRGADLTLKDEQGRDAQSYLNLRRASNLSSKVKRKVFDN